MNVLEKILEDIRNMRDIMKSTVATACFGKECENDDCTVCVCERVMKIISSYMNEVSTLEKKSVWEMDIMHHESYDLGRNVGWNECLEAIEYIENDGWIPVEEDLPKEKGWYQCTCSDKEIWNDDIVRDLYYYPGIKEFVDNIRYENNGLKDIEKYYWTKYVTAWQPLPEPYKVKEK